MTGRTGKPGEKMSSGRSPTMRDVARSIGVSHMTVSRVVNGDKAVRPHTRKRVEDAIKQLRFSPNSAARALSTAQPARVALLHRFPNAGSLGDYLIHLLQASTRAHASLIIREVVADDHKNVIDELIDDGIQGAILAPPLGDDEALIALLRVNRIAIVATGAIRHDIAFPSVGIDDRAAARAMTEHLLAHGHRRIGLITGRDNHASSLLRYEGYCDALHAAGLVRDDRLIAQGLFTYQSGLSAAERLLSLADPPTAIFASNDDMAAATVATGLRRGIDVPRDLSVCGFDDTPLATTVWPALTTIRQPTLDLTRIAFEMILREIAEPSRPDAHDLRVTLDYALVERQSDGPTKPPDAD